MKVGAKKNKVNTRFDYEKKTWGDKSALLNNESYKFIINNFLKAYKDKKGIILDVGCGAGHLIGLLAHYRPDLQFIGCDISLSSIQKAKFNYPQFQFVISNKNKLPFSQNYFDGIIANHVLEHIERPEKICKEIYRVLKPKGLFISATPLEGNYSSFIYYMRKFNWFDNNRIKYLGHIQKYSYIKYQAMFNNTGFIIVSTFWNGHLFYQLFDALYFPLLQLLKIRTNFILETKVSVSRNNILKLTAQFIKKIVYSIYYVESTICKHIPGYIVNLVAIKS